LNTSLLDEYITFVNNCTHWFQWGDIPFVFFHHLIW
jgi:hypothetical protein